MKNPFTSYPEGYARLVSRLVPFYMKPAKKLLMSLLIRILAEG